MTTSELVVNRRGANAQPFSVIEQKGLLARLGEELARAAGDLSRDPSGFIRAIFSPDTKDLRRSRRIRVGLACALVAHVALLSLVIFASWNRVFQKADKPTLEVTQWVGRTLDGGPEAPEPPKAETPRGTGGGGGGGGQRAPLPATKGVAPMMLPTDPIVRANPPTNPDPALPVMPNIVGPESPPPPPEAPVGVPNGKPGEFSPGTGSGGGVGEGKGAGVGSGTGGGAGPGGNGGTGGNNAGSPTGSPGGVPEAVDFNRLKTFPASSGVVWIHRPRPIVTPEAQQNKVIGTVMLRATFRSDGTISDIEVVSRVDFMTESAVESLMKSKFRPATINGVPITLRRVPVRIDVHY
ncbi:MAG TPA: energy transducer TonB [Blastocatellia bacterium]|nr:energy transducer TonB [Blastocatellia bacterium]